LTYTRTWTWMWTKQYRFFKCRNAVFGQSGPGMKRKMTMPELVCHRRHFWYGIVLRRWMPALIFLVLMLSARWELIQF
jgi:hypothetical protein